MSGETTGEWMAYADPTAISEQLGELEWTARGDYYPKPDDATALEALRLAALKGVAAGAAAVREIRRLQTENTALRKALGVELQSLHERLSEGRVL